MQILDNARKRRQFPPPTGERHHHLRNLAPRLTSSRLRSLNDTTSEFIEIVIIQRDLSITILTS
jgi:hypothetical protein